MIEEEANEKPVNLQATHQQGKISSTFQETANFDTFCLNHISSDHSADKKEKILQWK